MSGPDRNDRAAAHIIMRNTPLLLATALALALAACRPNGGDTPAGAEPAPATPPPTTSAQAVPAPAPVNAAAGATAAPATAAQSQWQCGDEHVSVRFEPATTSITVVHDSGELLLPQASSASGARYADSNGNEFWSKGPSGRLTLSGMPARECTGLASPAG